MEGKNAPRVRFAPSPTGYLHVGGARTALYNYLFARRHGGTFVLRLEDTDAARSREEYTASILEAMTWLGLDWDEGPDVGGPYGPYRQSQRQHIYEEHIRRLLAAEGAYECFCTAEELEERREAMKAAGQAPRYDGRCSRLSDEKKRRLRNEGFRPCVRFRMEGLEDLGFQDVIRGRVDIRPEDLDDFVIARPDGTPTYNFVCAVDDHAMGISHVIRGEDHISNTPRQVGVYIRYGWQPPTFAHLPLLLGPDKSRLSKRHGAKAVVEYRDEGVLPEALINFLALLGWSYDDEREFFTLRELTEVFSLERVSKKGAVFDVDKLLWMNGVYIRKLSQEELFRRAEPWLRRFIGEDAAKEDLARRALVLEQEKMRKLSQAPGLVDFFFTPEPAMDEKAAANLGKTPGGLGTLAALAGALGALPQFDAAAIEAAVREFAANNGWGAGKIIHAIRAALSGRTTGPSLFDMAALMGKEEVVARLKRAAAGGVTVAPEG